MIHKCFLLYSPPQMLGCSFGSSPLLLAGGTPSQLAPMSKEIRRMKEGFWKALCFSLTGIYLFHLFPSVPAKLRKYRLVLFHPALLVGLFAASGLHCVYVSDRIWFPGVLTQINSVPPQPQLRMRRLLGHLAWNV